MSKTLTVSVPLQSQLLVKEFPGKTSTSNGNIQLTGLTVSNSIVVAAYCDGNTNTLCVPYRYNTSGAWGVHLFSYAASISSRTETTRDLVVYYFKI